MPRIGQNPMKWQNSIHQSEKITAATIVHIPFLDGFWKHSLDVLKLCLQSMRENTNKAFDLMVFDNGSCSEVKNYLSEMHRKGEIQFLIFSEKNIGKVGAWNFLFSAAPGEIIAYSDSDVYFLPNWLESSIEVLKAFPESGMITSQPIAGGDLSQFWTTQMAMSDSSVSVRIGILIPEDFLRSHLEGIGFSSDEYEKRQKNRKDVLLTRGQISAYATASHFQFLTTRNVVKKLFPADTRKPLGDATQFDVEMQKLGNWRLSTEDYLVHHMGNRLPNIKSELPWAKNIQILSFNSDYSSVSQIKNTLRNRFIRNVLKKILTTIYKLLYGK